MLHRIERGDSVDLAREFGIVTTHTFDGVRQKFTALCTKAPAVVARSGVLPKNPLINAKKIEQKNTYPFTNERHDCLAPIAFVDLHEFTKIFIDYEYANTFDTALHLLHGRRNLLTETSTTDTQSNGRRFGRSRATFADGFGSYGS